MIGFIMFISIMILMIISGYFVNKDNGETKLSEKNKEIFMFDKENVIEIDTNKNMIHLLINDEKISRSAIDHVKIDRILKHLFFTRTNMFIGGCIFLLILIISYFILNDSSISNQIWIQLFISSFITGCIFGGLKKKYLNSYIYFFLNDESVRIITIKYNSNNIDYKLKRTELLRDKLIKMELMKK